MKKIFVVITTLILCVVCALGISACKRGDSGKSYNVYVPDGAPALSVAGIGAASLSTKFDVKVVKSDTITSYVGGNNPRADFAVLPVNAAVKLLGNGEKYKLLGTVTHGNLFLMKKQGGEDISDREDLAKLTGKTVGVINLANVPGLTFKVILSDNDIPYNELKDGAEVATDKVNLKSVTAQEATPANADCDYFVVPEPAASTKQAATQGKLSFAGNLQTLYGGENGYPQAVAVAREEIASSNKAATDEFIASFASTREWLLSEDTSAESIANAVKSMTEGDMAPTFTAANLSKEVISNCGIRFTDNKVGKIDIQQFIKKLNAVSANAWGEPEEKFFY